MNVKLTWTDRNTNETGHRIYRSSSPMDTATLPPPVAELGPNVTEWEDTDTPVDQVVYYIVSAVRGAEEAFSDEVMIDTTPANEPEYVAASFSGYYESATTATVITPQETQVGDLIVLIVGHRSALTSTPGGSVEESTASTLTPGQMQTVLSMYAGSAGQIPLDISVGVPDRLWMAAVVFRVPGGHARVGVMVSGFADFPDGIANEIVPVEPVISLPGSSAPLVLSAISSQYAATTKPTILRPIAAEERIVDTSSINTYNQARFGVGLMRRPSGVDLGVAFQMTSAEGEDPDTLVGHTFEIVVD